MGVLRLIFLRDIDYYIHRLFAFYFIFFGLILLFVEVEARTFQKHFMFLTSQGGKSLLNWFLGCMCFFNVNFDSNKWWEYVIGVYMFTVASQQMLLALIYTNEDRERVERRARAIEEEDEKERIDEEKRIKEEEEWERAQNEESVEDIQNNKETKK